MSLPMIVNFTDDRFVNVIIGLGTNYFEVNGDVTANFTVGSIFEIWESPNANNDGNWTVLSIAYNTPLNKTTINVIETVNFAFVGGMLGDKSKRAITIAPGDIVVPNTNTTTPSTAITLFGRGYLQYGERLNENLVHLLENFASPQLSLNVPDPNILKTETTGQLWFNTSTKTLMVYNGQQWVASSGMYVSTIAPTVPKIGDLWFDTSIYKLKVYTGSLWILVPSALVTPTTPSSPSSGDFWFDTNALKLKIYDGVTWQLPSILTAGNGLYFTGDTINIGTANSGRIVINADNIDLGVTGVSIGTYNTLTVDVYGRITTGSNTAYLTGNQNITLSGDITGSGATAITTSLSTTGVGSGTYSKVTVDNKGRVTAGSSITSSDITAGLGYTPVNKAGDTMAGFLTLNANPTNALHAATKQYADAIYASWKTYYGDGSDGAFTSSGSFTFAANNKEYWYTTFNLQNGHTITASQGWPIVIRATVSITISGNINGYGLGSSGGVGREYYGTFASSNGNSGFFGGAGGSTTLAIGGGCYRALAILSTNGENSHNVFDTIQDRYYQLGWNASIAHGNATGILTGTSGNWANGESGGGGGGADGTIDGGVSGCQGRGANGGALVFLIAPTIIINNTSSIDLRGNDGHDKCQYAGDGGGGGGGGGLFLCGKSITNNASSILVSGGIGGLPSIYGGVAGKNGGNGGVYTVITP